MATCSVARGAAARVEVRSAIVAMLQELVRRGGPSTPAREHLAKLVNAWVSWKNPQVMTAADAQQVLEGVAAGSGGEGAASAGAEEDPAENAEPDRKRPRS